MSWIDRKMLPADANWIAADAHGSGKEWFSYREQPCFDPFMQRWGPSAEDSGVWRLQEERLPASVLALAPANSLIHRSQWLHGPEPARDTAAIAAAISETATALATINDTLIRLLNELEIANEQARRK